MDRHSSGAKHSTPIDTDCNGKMIEDWTINFNLHHLNQTENCIGINTFNSNKGKSAIDHILVNDKMYGNYKGMHIDEEKILLNISDHCLVRAWFKLGTNIKTKWKKKLKRYNNLKKMRNHSRNLKQPLPQKSGKEQVLGDLWKK